MFPTLLVLLSVLLVASGQVNDQEFRIRRSLNSENVLTSQLSRLHLKLFQSLQKRIKMMKMAVFETKCTKTRCTFSENHMYDEQVCKQGWRKFKGHCYTFYKTGVPWANAQKSCAKMGSSLVQIDNKEENDWLTGQFKQAFWTDGTDSRREGNWFWFTAGKKIGPFTAWRKASKEPNGKTSENCLHVNENDNGSWNDGSCNSKIPYVCEM